MLQSALRPLDRLDVDRRVGAGGGAGARVGGRSSLGDGEFARTRR